MLRGLSPLLVSLPALGHLLRLAVGRRRGSSNVAHPQRIYAEAGADARACIVAWLECAPDKTRHYVARGMRAMGFQGLNGFIPNGESSP